MIKGEVERIHYEVEKEENGRFSAIFKKGKSKLNFKNFFKNEDDLINQIPSIVKILERE